ncbi:MAG TPA: tautomerase family protein [Thermoanaerobaculia bacterium]|nr:tautomerase family protein [Thermoanaerobaculia bacterium]
MPLLHIHLSEARGADLARSVAREVFRALVDVAKAPEESQFCYIDVYPADRILSHPTYGGVERHDPVLIEITMNVGRTAEVKTALYAAVASNLNETLRLRPDDVMICLREVPKENWSFGGGRATYL